MDDYSVSPGRGHRAGRKVAGTADAEVKAESALT
jgi:hypothetical protein